MSGSALAAFTALLVIAPLLPGIAVKTKSLLTGRRGAPVLQLYFDLWKLLWKQSVYSTTTTWIFRAGPVVMLGSLVAAGLFLPLNGRAAPAAFEGDLVAFAALLALGRFALVLAGLDTGSSFEGMGASREVTFASLVELALFIALAALSVATHSLSLSGMLGAPLAAQWAKAAPAIILIAAALFVLLLAECARSPLDDPTTHLELTMIHEVMILDHSGPDLGAILYASALKLALLGVVVSRVAWPIAEYSTVARFGALAASVLVVGGVVGVVEASMARVRLTKVPLVVASAVALSALGLVLVLG